MEKKLSLEKAVEIFVLITLPIALIVGCEGTLKERAEIDRTDESMVIEQSYNLKDIHPLFSTNEGSVAINDIIQKKEMRKSELMVLSQEDQVSKVDPVVSKSHSEESMMNVLFVEAENPETTKSVLSIGDNNTPMLKVNSAEEDILVAGVAAYLYGFRI